jgi:prevent-host-death family protein
MSIHVLGAGLPCLPAYPDMIYNMTMIKVNIADAKARLSEYLEAAVRGERIVICKRNRPIAELCAVAAPRTARRPLGRARNFVVPDTFFDPLPADMLARFDGEAEEEPGTRPQARGSRVAEDRAADSKHATRRGRK